VGGDPATAVGGIGRRGKNLEQLKTRKTKFPNLIMSKIYQKYEKTGQTFLLSHFYAKIFGVGKKH